MKKSIKFEGKNDFEKNVNFLKKIEHQSANLNECNLLHFIPADKLAKMNYQALTNEIESVYIIESDQFEGFIGRFNREASKKRKLIEVNVEKALNSIRNDISELGNRFEKLSQVKLFSKQGLWLKILKHISGVSSKLKIQIELFDQSLKLGKIISGQLALLSKNKSLNTPESIDSIGHFISFVEKELSCIADSKFNIQSESYERMIRQSFLGVEFDEELLIEYQNWEKKVNQFLVRYTMPESEKMIPGTSRCIKKFEWVLQCTRNYKKAEGESFIRHFEWQLAFYQQPDFLQKMILLMLTTKVKNWHSYYTEWYLHHLLSEKLDITLAGGYDEQLRTLKEGKRRLEKEIKDKIPCYWRAKQSELTGINITQIYNKRGSRNRRRNSLRNIAEQSFNSLTTYLPVMMVSPNVCASMFKLKPGLFDYVIFDEASQLKIEETLSVLIRGDRKIISGDSNQMPPSYWFTAVADNSDIDGENNFDPFNSWEENLQTTEGARDLAESESLLEFAELCRFKPFKLDFHYRSHHPLLIEFSNAAFYKSRLHPLPERISHSPIQFIRVDGTYEGQLNRDEAGVVVEILRNIKAGNDGNYPTVGIATFNQKQKNLVLELIKREAQLDEGFRKKYLVLEEDGLFVKNLENIQGDERDVIILCTTFGPDGNGRFIRNYGPVTRTGLGRRLLNVIVTRARKKIFVLSSIPEKVIGNYRQELGENRETESGYLHAYLAYAKAVSDKDVVAIESVLNFLKELRGVQSVNLGLTESPFEEAVYQSLIEFIDKDRVSLQHKAGGFRIDITIISKVTGREYLAIECDGATYHGSAEDYAWDNYRQAILEEHGFKFHRIWSRDFWENPDREIKKLVSFIETQDEIDTDLKIKDELSTSDIDLENLLQGTNVTIEENEQLDENEENQDDRDGLYETEIGYNTEYDDPEIEIQVKTGVKIEIGNIVSVKDHKSGDILKVKLATGRSDSIISNGINIVDRKSPIGEALIGRHKGETVEINNLERYYTILEIN